MAIEGSTSQSPEREDLLSVSISIVYIESPLNPVTALYSLGL